MATVIDALIVTLGLDGSNFKKGADEVKKAQKDLAAQSNKNAKDTEQQEKKLSAAEKQRHKEIEARSKQIAQGISKVRNEALSLFAAFATVSGLKNFAINAVNTSASLGRLSDNLGMNAKEVAKWQLANELAGGSVAGMTELLNKSADEMANFRSMGEVTEGMQRFILRGGSADAFKDAETYLKARADLIAKIYKANPTQAIADAKVMGIDESTINFIKQGTGAIEQQRQAVSALADEQAKMSKESQETQKQMKLMEDSFAASGNKILTLLLPAMIEVANVLAKIVNLVSSPKFATVGGLVGDRNKKFSGSFMDAMTGNKGKSGTIKFTKEDEALEAANLAFLKNSGSLNSSPRGLRNNNPGNLNFANQSGATKESGANGRFAVFKSGDEGLTALSKQLSLYKSRGIQTVKDIISKFAPPSENNTKSYISSVSKKLGVSENSVLDVNNPAVKAELMRAIISVENGRNPYSQDKLLSIAGQNNALASVNLPKNAKTNSINSKNGASTSKTDVTINGGINVNTQASDAKGIARSIGSEIHNVIVRNADTGLS